MKILMIEDSIAVAGELRRLLEGQYLIESVQTGARALQKLTGTTYDVILLDLNLPDMNGLQVCKQARALGATTPILVITSHDTTKHRVSLLNAGADDFVGKPFSGDEIKARVSALARRSVVYNHELRVVADLVLNTGTREVTRAGTPISLRRREFDILEYLMRLKGSVVSRQKILSHVWESNGKSFEKTVDVHIKNLREKVDKPFKKQLIKTSYGLGYMIDDSEEV